MEKYYEKNPSNIPAKEIDQINTDDITIFDINEEDLITKENPRFGVYNLGVGVAVIMKDVYSNHAAAHVLTDIDLLLYSMLNKLNNTDPIEVMIIPGKSSSTDQINNIITFLQNKNNFMRFQVDIKIINLEHYTNKKTNRIDFVFDSITNQFYRPSYEVVEEFNKGRSLWAR